MHIYMNEFIFIYFLTNDKILNQSSTCRQQNKCNLRVEIYSELGLKTFWEKEKMLGASIFSFSQNVFENFLL